jgi:hypothetical protein
MYVGSSGGERRPGWRRRTEYQLTGAADHALRRRSDSARIDRQRLVACAIGGYHAQRLVRRHGVKHARAVGRQMHRTETRPAASDAEGLRASKFLGNQGAVGAAGHIVKVDLFDAVRSGWLRSEPHESCSPGYTGYAGEIGLAGVIGDASQPAVEDVKIGPLARRAARIHRRGKRDGASIGTCHRRNQVNRIEPEECGGLRSHGRKQ